MVVLEWSTRMLSRFATSLGVLPIGPAESYHAVMVIMLLESTRPSVGFMVYNDALVAGVTREQIVSVSSAI